MAQFHRPSLMNRIDQYGRFIALDRPERAGLPFGQFKGGLPMRVEQSAVALSYGKVDILAGGSGAPLVVLHRETGRGGWGRLHERLAAHYRVIAPSLPGYDGSDRPAFLRNVTDLAALTGFVLDRINVKPAAFLGLGFGGWVAAEIAAHGPGRVSQLILHSPLGVKPSEGEIADQFLFEPENYVRRGFSSEAAYEKAFPGGDMKYLEQWDRNREMTTRIAYKPAMFDLGLPHLLKDLKVPTLVAWSDQDRIAPRSCATIYRDAIAGADYVELKGSGHHADLETPDALADLVLGRLAQDHRAAAAQ
jgi:pimeloyl-ACP methyl ester carboxylesterase